MPVALPNESRYLEENIQKNKKCGLTVNQISNLEEQILLSNLALCLDY